MISGIHARIKGYNSSAIYIKLASATVQNLLAGIEEVTVSIQVAAKVL